jgi:hypothetical protein
MELNYRNLITKGFVSWGIITVLKRKVRRNQKLIQQKHEMRIKRQYFEQYRITYEKQLIGRLLEDKAEKFYKGKILTRRFNIWKQVIQSKLRKIKDFQVPWQPKMLVEIIAHSYGISLKRGYHEVMDKIAHKIRMPPCREGRVLEAISMLNYHILQGALSTWKVYTRKCLELRYFLKFFL